MHRPVYKNLSNINQFDGNDSLSDSEMDIVDLTEEEIYALDIDLVQTGYSVENVTEKNYEYTINKGNQTRRLVENANKAPIRVTYKDLKRLGGKQHATNANIEFNAGLYLSAIKPTLSGVHEGWKSVVHGTCITCHKMSPRMDKSGMIWFVLK